MTWSPNFLETFIFHCYIFKHMAQSLLDTKLIQFYLKQFQMPQLFCHNSQSIPSLKRLPLWHWNSRYAKMAAFNYYTIKILIQSLVINACKKIVLQITRQNQNNSVKNILRWRPTHDETSKLFMGSSFEWQDTFLIFCKSLLPIKMMSKIAISW